jgi:C-terminal processing protease CtpA/Prc
LPLALGVGLSLAGCKPDAPAADCSPTAEKGAVLATARSWYLYAGGIPQAGLDPTDATQTPQQFLDAVTAVARAAGTDRHFSYLTTRAAETSFFQEGTSVGYGIGLKRVGASQLFVTQVFGGWQTPGGSPAARAGLARGDELLALADPQGGDLHAALDAPAAQLAALLAADDAAPGALSAALGSGVAGNTRAFRVRRADGVTVADLTATTALYSLDPVPWAAAPITFEVAGKKVGYLLLRTFIGPADPLLRQAAAALKAAGVTDVIIDLRYNGGGRLDVAGTFLDLLRGSAGPSDLAFRLRYNDQHRDRDAQRLFHPTADSISPVRVAFIVTGSTASASEDLVNALQPWLRADVAVIGARTLGKPLGQDAFADPACDWILRLITIQAVNADGAGDFYQGLPDAAFTGSSCAAEDDLGHALGSPLEASTAAALQWIADGSCAAGPIPPPAAPLASVAPAARFPAPPEPTLAQRHQPGLF